MYKVVQIPILSIMINTSLYQLGHIHTLLNTLQTYIYIYIYIYIYHWRRKRGGGGGARGHVPPTLLTGGGNGMFVPPHF